MLGKTLRVRRSYDVRTLSVKYGANRTHAVVERQSGDISASRMVSSCPILLSVWKISAA